MLEKPHSFSSKKVEPAQNPAVPQGPDASNVIFLTPRPDDPLQRLKNVIRHRRSEMIQMLGGEQSAANQLQDHLDGNPHGTTTWRQAAGGDEGAIDILRKNSQKPK
jgi:hypothetical protein